MIGSSFLVPQCFEYPIQWIPLHLMFWSKFQKVIDLKSYQREHIHKRDRNYANWHLGIIPFKNFIWINSVNFFSKEHLLSILGVSTSIATRSTLVIVYPTIVLFFPDNLMSFSNIPWIGMCRTYVQILVVIILWSYRNSLSHRICS